MMWSWTGNAVRTRNNSFPQSRSGLKGDIGNYSILALAQCHGIRLGRASEKLTMSGAPPPVARLLEVEPGEMLLRLDRLIFCRHDDLIEWHMGFCRLEDQPRLAEMN